MTKDATEWRWSSASRSEVGMVRTLNEDAVLDLPELGLWMVADGMGGHAAGDFASGAIVSALASIPPPSSLGALIGEVRQRLQTVNGQLNETARNRGLNVIGSTVVALLAFGDHGIVVWAGDSRAYRFRHGELAQLTRDHSEAEDIVRLGLMSPEQVREHPASNVITRAVGGADILELDAEMFPLAPDDTFLLCSDGLYRELDDDAIKVCLALGDCRRSCDALTDAALAQQARDNVSVIVVRMGEETQPTRTQLNPAASAGARRAADHDDPTERG